MRTHSLGVASVLGGALLLFGGCTVECVDRYDCRNVAPNAATLTCVEHRCVRAFSLPTTLPPGLMDAGSTVPPGDSGTFLERRFVARLTGRQVAPLSVSTLASGTAELTLLGPSPDGGFSLRTQVTHDAGAATSVRLRAAPGGVGDAVTIADLNPSDSGSAAQLAVDPTVAVLMARGLTFIDVASVARPGGEIRGQVLGVGEFMLTSVLSGASQVPPNAHPGTGGVSFIASVTSGSLRYDGRWSTDVAAISAALHQGGPGAVGAMLAPLTLTDGGAGCSGQVPLTALFAAGDAGLYVTVATADAGVGLLRGMLLPQ